MKINKETKYIITVILVAIMLSGSYFAVQFNKQKSIEKQVSMKIEADKAEQERELNAEKEEQEKKLNAEALVEEGKEDERLRKECLEIYKTEDKKWNNVISWDYWKWSNSCRIRYKNKEYKEWDKERMEREGIEEYFINTF